MVGQIALAGLVRAERLDDLVSVEDQSASAAPRGYVDHV